MEHIVLSFVPGTKQVFSAKNKSKKMYQVPKRHLVPGTLMQRRVQQ
jgi:hypothetical protein